VGYAGVVSGVEATPRGDQAIVLRTLEKSWRGPSGPIRAVRGIDIAIERGETVALLGPNGADRVSRRPACAGRRGA
jgi:ABC-type lipopolysaccharide export system ATPase subunit